MVCPRSATAWKISIHPRRERALSSYYTKTMRMKKMIPSTIKPFLISNSYFIHKYIFNQSINQYIFTYWINQDCGDLGILPFQKQLPAHPRHHYPAHNLLINHTPFHSTRHAEGYNIHRKLCHDCYFLSKLHRFISRVD